MIDVCLRSEKRRPSIATHTHAHDLNLQVRCSDEQMSKRPRADEDAPSDRCNVCDSRKGILLCCDKCPRAYHLSCVGLTSMPPGEWQCVACHSEASEVAVAAAVPTAGAMPSTAPAVTPAPKSPETQAQSANGPSASCSTLVAASGQQPSPMSHASAAAGAATAIAVPEDMHRQLAELRENIDTLSSSFDAEDAHVAQKLAAVDTRLADVRRQLAKLEDERAELVKRSVSLASLRQNLTSLSTASPRPPPPAMSPSALTSPVGGFNGGGGIGGVASGTTSNASEASVATFGRQLSRPNRFRTAALWHPACLRHAPASACPEQPTRLSAVVKEMQDVAAAHPSLLTVVSATSPMVDLKIVKLAHTAEYVSGLETAQPKHYEPPARLGSAPSGGVPGGGLVWADGERRSMRESVRRPSSSVLPAAAVNNGGGYGDGYGHGAPAPAGGTAMASLGPAENAAALPALVDASGQPPRGARPRHLLSPSRWQQPGTRQAPCARRSTSLSAASAAIASWRRGRPATTRAPAASRSPRRRKASACSITSPSAPSTPSATTRRSSRASPSWTLTSTTGMGRSRSSKATPPSYSSPSTCMTRRSPSSQRPAAAAPRRCASPARVTTGRSPSATSSTRRSRVARGGRPTSTRARRCSSSCASGAPTWSCSRRASTRMQTTPSAALDAGGPGLSEADFGWLTEQIVEVADATCAGRVVSVLEGGYSPPVLRKCVAAHLRALMGAKPKAGQSTNSKAGSKE